MHRRVPDLTDRALRAVERMDQSRWNASARDGEWTVPQVFRHMWLANAPYLTSMRRAIEAAPSGPDVEARHTWFGRFLLKAAGPTGNAPAPKALHPEPGPYGREVVNAWRAQQDETSELARLAEGRDLSAARFRNPFIRVVRMNSADGFAILLEHTERHVLQIEERSAKLA